MLLTAVELSEIDPETYSIKEEESEGVLYVSLFENGKRVMSTQKSEKPPLEGVAFGCIRKGSTYVISSVIM